MASKVQVDAAKRDYIIKPRLDYRTVQGVNGPLVILEVRTPRASPLPPAPAPPRAPPPPLSSLLCAGPCPPPATRGFLVPSEQTAARGRHRRAR